MDFVKSIFMATFTIFFISSAFCYAKKDDSFQPILVLNKTIKPPDLDGTLDDECWKHSSGSVLLANNSYKKLSDKTWFLATYDDHNLYVAFYGEQRFLKPVLNMLDKVRVHSAKHDVTLIKYDDVFGINILDKETYSRYEFKVNMNGITWDSKDNIRKWNSGMKAAAAADARGYWTAEIMIPFRALGVKKIQPGLKLHINFFRKNVPADEVAAWNPTQGRLNDMQKMGTVELSDNSPIVQCKNLQRRTSDALVEVSIKSPFKVLLKDSNHSREVPANVLQKIDFELTPNKNNKGQMVLEQNGNVFFRTPVINLNSSVYPMTAVLQNPGGQIESFFNGKKIASGDNDLSFDLNVIKNKNVLFFKLTPGEKPPSGTISIAGKDISLKSFLFSYSSIGNWKLYNGEKLKRTAYFKFNIIQNHTIFAPQLPENTLYVANYAPMRIGIRLCSPFKNPIRNATIHLQTPSGIKIPVHDIVNRGYTSCWHKLKRLKKNEFTDYQFSFSSQIKKQPHAFSSRTLHIYINPEFPIAQEGKTLQGSFYIEGDGFLELPRLLKINVLPRLDGQQPKNIIIASWFEMNNYIYSFSELLELMESLKPMGINTMGIAYRLGPRMPACFENDNQAAIAEFAHKNNIRTISCNHGYNDSKFLYDIHLRYPQWSKIGSSGKPKGSPWTHYLCPLAFMKSQDVKKRIQELATIHDGICYDLEAGIGKSCLCKNCRNDIKKRFHLQKTPSLKDVMKPEMRDIWTKHQVGINKRVYDFIMKSAQEVNPKIKTAVYSGGATTPLACYGMDWTLFKGKVDYPISGYQENSKIMQKNRDALGGSPYIAGLFIGNKLFAQENDNQEITARCFYQLAAGGYLGILLFENTALDGRGMHAFAKFSRGTARFEHYFNDNLKLKNGFNYVKGLPKDCIHVFKHNDKLLYLLINRAGVKRQISFAVPNGTFNNPEAFDFYSNKIFTLQNSWNKYVIPANEALLIEVKEKSSFWNTIF